jgi:recombination protein RecA
VIKKSGSWFSYGDSKLAQGREAVKQLLADNTELCEEIEAKIREALQNVQD